MDEKTPIIIVMALIILAGAGVMAYQYVQEEAYQEGIQDGTLIINQQILNSLEQNGYVPFIFERDNQTYNIKLIPQLQNE